MSCSDSAIEILSDNGTSNVTSASASWLLSSLFQTANGTSRVTGSLQWSQWHWARCVHNCFMWSQTSVIVPMVERVVRTVLRWPSAIAGGMPSMRSTCGLSIRSKNWRTYGENVST